MKKRRISKKRVAYALVVFLSYLLIFWIVLSIIDTNTHNKPDDIYGQYASWNLFNNFC